MWLKFISAIIAETPLTYNNKRAKIVEEYPYYFFRNYISYFYSIYKKYIYTSGVDEYLILITSITS